MTADTPPVVPSPDDDVIALAKEWAAFSCRLFYDEPCTCPTSDPKPIMTALIDRLAVVTPMSRLTILGAVDDH